MFNPVLCSYLMEINMEYFVLMNLSTTALALILVPIMAYIPLSGQINEIDQIQKEGSSIGENKTEL